MSCYKPGLGPPPFAHTSQRCQSSGSLSDQGCLVLPAGECGGHNLPCLFSCPEHWTAFAILAMFSFPPDRPPLFFPQQKVPKLWSTIWSGGWGLPAGHGALHCGGLAPITPVTHCHLVPDPSASISFSTKDKSNCCRKKNSLNEEKIPIFAER